MEVRFTKKDQIGNAGDQYTAVVTIPTKCLSF